MKSTNKYQTRADGMHYRQAWGREIDVVNLDEGVSGTVRFKATGQETECIGFRQMCKESVWYLAMKDPYQGGPDWEHGNPVLVDAVLAGTEWNDLLVYTAPGSYNAHSRERYKVK